MQVPLAVCVCFSDLLLRMRVLKENNFSTFSTVIWHPHTFFLSTVHLQFPYKILFFPSSGHFFQIRSIKVHRFPHPNHPCQPRQQLDRQRNTTHQTPATAKDDDATAAMADERLVVLQPGQRVNNRWTITRKLGEGAFGAVYLCRDDNGLSAALKTEPLDAKPPLLAMEAQVLRELHNIRDGRHFTRCHELGRAVAPDNTGRQVTYNYIVMALVGKSLDKLIAERPSRRFSPGTAIGISIQMVNALRALHQIGYLHRDIKPANTTIGRPEDGETRVIYLLDFGMARRYTRPDGTHRRPRPSSNFRGSPRYAAISAHINREYSRKDDIESWFYMMVEVYKGSLPWSNCSDMNQIGDYKKLRQPDKPADVRRQAVRDLIDGCPMEFGELLKHIDSLRFYTRPDYRWIMNLLRTYLTNNRIPEHPYDWEQGGGQHRAPAPPTNAAVNSYFQ